MGAWSWFCPRCCQVTRGLSGRPLCAVTGGAWWSWVGVSLCGLQFPHLLNVRRQKSWARRGASPSAGLTPGAEEFCAGGGRRAVLCIVGPSQHPWAPPTGDQWHTPALPPVATTKNVSRICQMPLERKMRLCVHPSDQVSRGGSSWGLSAQCSPGDHGWHGPACKDLIFTSDTLSIHTRNKFCEHPPVPFPCQTLGDPALQDEASPPPGSRLDSSWLG